MFDRGREFYLFIMIFKLLTAKRAVSSGLSLINLKATHWQPEAQATTTALLVLVLVVVHFVFAGQSSRHSREDKTRWTRTETMTVHIFLRNYELRNSIRVTFFGQADKGHGQADKACTTVVLPVQP